MLPFPAGKTRCYSERGRAVSDNNEEISMNHNKNSDTIMHIGTSKIYSGSLGLKMPPGDIMALG